LSKLCDGLQARVVGADVEVSGLVYDSRRVVPGVMFAALKGAHADGHDHIARAVQAGAVAVLCERELAVAPATAVVVKNSRLALAQAAQVFYGDPAAQLLMVGVTGTNGKTTTIHLLESVLSAAGHRVGLVGTLGTRFEGRSRETGMTTPESADLVAMLQEMRCDGATAVAMEVSSHALAQDRVAGVQFDVGIFTNLTHDHLDYHGTLEAYFAAKTRLFSERLKSSGLAVLNLDDERVARFAAMLPTSHTIGFSLVPEHPTAACRLHVLTLDSRGIAMRLSYHGHTFDVHSPLVGRFNAANVLGAVAVGCALGLSSEVITRGIEELSAVPGRLERISGQGAPLVLVDYAHTPDALQKALSTVRELVPGRLVCVFGCGGDRDPHKRPVMGQVAATHADLSIVTNDNPRSEAPEAILAAIESGFVAAGAKRLSSVSGAGYCLEANRATAIQMAVAAAKPGDAVLIAGKGHENYQQIGTMKWPFDDREQGRAALTMAGFPAEGA